jgi:hypothetical protein
LNTDFVKIQKKLKFTIPTKLYKDMKKRKISLLLTILFITGICMGTTHVVTITINPFTGQTFKITAAGGTLYETSTGGISFSGKVSIVPIEMRLLPEDPADTLDSRKIGCGAKRIWVQQPKTGSYFDIENNECVPSANLGSAKDPILNCLRANNWLCRATISGSKGLVGFESWDCIFPHRGV